MADKGNRVREDELLGHVQPHPGWRLKCRDCKRRITVGGHASARGLAAKAVRAGWVWRDAWPRCPTHAT